MKMKNKNWGTLALLAVLVVGVALICGCIGGPGEGPGGAPGGGAGGGGSSGGTSGGGSTSGWCAVGTYVTTPEGTMRVTGIEKHTINGKSVNLCCTEIEGSDEEVGTVKIKTCYSKDNDYGLMFGYTEERGTWVKTMETYPEGDNICMRMFDEEGNVMMEGCSPRE